MSRRSARLVSGGYYQSDEDSDSSSVTNISYRESPVRVFKKKAGSRKSDTRTLSRANSNASSVDTEPIVTDQTNPEPDQYKGLKSALATGPTEQNMRTLPYSPTSGPTPRPALIPARGRSRTPTLRPDAAPPESGSPAGASGPGGAAGSLHASYSRLLNQNSVDNSSGYSSAEGPRRRIPANTPPAAASGRRAPAAPGHTSSSSYYYNGGLNAKKALSGLLLLLLLLTCVYYLVPLLALVVSRLTVAKTTTPTPAATQPVSRAVPPAVPVHRPTAPPPLLPPPQPAPQLCPAPPTPAAVDPALLSAAVAEEMDHVLEKLLLKQENLHSQAEQTLQRTLQQELQALRARLEAVDSSGRLRLEAEAGELSRLLAENQAAAGSASSALAHRVLALETHNEKLREELSSIQTRPEPAPCPAPDQAPVQNQLTPELQQAMENWLADRMKEHYISGLGSENSCTDCGRPMADKMADFALESQGASVVSTRCSETYSIRSACVTLFGFPLWYPSESPRTVIQGYPVLLPGKCWAFRGVQGTLVLSLSHPVAITHVTLDHLPRYNAPTGRIDSAPRDFEVYGMESATEEGPLLGTFTYDQDGESTQTFQLPQSSDELHRFVELRILSNWGQMEYTCVYRFRVHGKMAST